MIISPPPSATTFHRLIPPTSTFPHTLHTSTGDHWSSGGAVKEARLPSLLCKAVSKPRTEEYFDVLQKNGSPFAPRQNDTLEAEADVDADYITIPTPKVAVPSDEIQRYVDTIKEMLGSMEDGEITPSAYDTAWVALVRDVNGNGGPQFPSALEWIVKNQLPDGSWGDDLIFSSHDRIINTLACVVALTSWNIHPDKCQKGMKFVKENIHKLGDEKEEHMPIGFEMVFPSLIEFAKKLNIEVPEATVLEEIYARRSLKLAKIPKDKMHQVPTTLLHSLEGMPDLEWEKLLKLQCKDGSFLFSPSSTAFAFMQTKDENCLRYLTYIDAIFNGEVPNVYPVDLFEHIWAVDRLERLGISRYFQPELKDCVDYIKKYWTEEGICWARISNVQDIDDTAMGFRILRMNGHQVSPDVFKHFERDGKFVCFNGEITQAVTGMFNLYRGSQVLFPGEKILEDAKKFSFNYLKKKQSVNELLDKWIIAKDLPGEVGFALEVPWYAILPRVETRYYLEQYGGEDDVWIGKTLYRMKNVSNNIYLEMAKLDYNNCLAMHQQEWHRMQQWYADFNIGEFGTRNIRSLLFSYYVAAASIFEPERSKERIAWAKTLTLIETINSFFIREQLSNEQKQAFVDDFLNTSTSHHHSRYGKEWKGLMGAVHGTLYQLSLDALVAHGKDVHPNLHHAWEMWLTSLQEEAEVTESQAELIVKTINISAGRWDSDDLLSNPQYQRLAAVTNNVCHQLSKFHDSKGDCTDGFKNGTMDPEIESGMQELVQLVLSDSSSDLERGLKQTFLTVAKTFYYRAYCDPKTINVHVSKVLFENVN